MARFARNLPIPGTSVTVTFPPGTYFVTEPAVVVGILGAPTHYDAVLVHHSVAGVGEVYTSINLTFQAGAVGKQFALIVDDGGA
jgi:hypothetical protein